MATVYLSFKEKVEIFPVHPLYLEEEETIEGKDFILKGKNQLIGIFYPERALCDSPWECVPSAFYNYLWQVEVLSGSMEDIVEWLMIHEPAWISAPKIEVLKDPLKEEKAKEFERRRKNNLQRRVRFIKKSREENPDCLFVPLRLTELALSERKLRAVIHEKTSWELTAVFATAEGIVNFGEALTANGFESERDELLDLNGIKKVCFTLGFQHYLDVPFFKGEVEEMLEKLRGQS